MDTALFTLIDQVITILLLFCLYKRLSKGVSKVWYASLHGNQCCDQFFDPYPYLETLSSNPVYIVGMHKFPMFG